MLLKLSLCVVLMSLPTTIWLTCPYCCDDDYIQPEQNDNSHLSSVHIRTILKVQSSTIHKTVGKENKTRERHGLD